MKTNLLKLPASRLGLLMLLCLSEAGTHAATITWTNVSGGTWNTAANWSPNSVPGGGDVAVITNTGNYTVTLNVSASIAGFVLGGDSGTQTFNQNGQPFSLSGDGEIRTQGVFNLSSGAYGGTGTNVVTGTFNWSAGIMSGSGTLQIADGGTLNITSASDHDVPAWRLRNAGTVVWAGGNVRGGTGTIIHNAGLWDVQSTNEINAAYGGVVSFSNAGTFRKSAGSGTTTIQSSVTFANTGAVEVQSGTLTLTGGGSNSGGFNVVSNSVVNFNSSFSFASGSTYTGAGRNLLVAGTHTMSGTITTENLELVGGTLAGSHVFNGLLKWSSGDMNSPGSTTISSNCTLRMLTGNDHNLNGRTLTNLGTVVWSGGNVRGGAGTIIHNAGLWDVQSTNEINAAYGGVVSFSNAGTFRKSAGSGTTTIQSSVTFANTGAVDVQSGTLSLIGGGSNGGGFNVASNAVVNFNSSFSFASGSTYTGAGRNRLVAGTHTMNGAITTENLELVGGTLAGTNVMIGTLKWSTGNMNSGGSTTISSGSTLQVLTVADHDLNGRTLTNLGTVAWSSGNVRGGTGTIMHNAGLWDVQSDHEINAPYGGVVTFNNAGTFRKSAGSGTTTIQSSVTFANTGAVDVQSGTLSLIGGGSNGGGFNVASNAVVNFNSSFSFASGSTYTGAGRNRLVAGTHTMNGAITTENLELVGGTLAGTNVMIGTLKWSTGNMNSGGSTTISSGSTLQVLTVADHDLNGRTLTNLGTVAWSSGNVRGGTGTIMHNAGLWDVQSDHEINAPYGGVVTFNNAGTFRKSAGSGTTTIQSSVTFANTGAVDVQSGTLSLIGGGSNGGGFNVASNAVVNFNSGFSFGSGSVFTGAGRNRLVAGTHTMNGAITTENLELVGGTLAGTNVMIGTLKWSTGNMNSGGSTTISSGSTLQVLTVADHDLNGRTLTNLGTVAWSSGNVRGGTGTIMHNAGLWDVQSDHEINAPYGGVVTFNNAGTFRKSAASGTTTIQSSVSFNNTGTLDVQTGIVSLNGSRNLAAGTINIGISSLTTFGKVSLSGASAFTGNFSANLIGGYIPITNNSFPVITYGSLSGLFTNYSLPFADAWTNIYSPTTFSLYVFNARPIPPSITNQVVSELTTLTVTNTALDLDVPTNTLAYTLLSPPAGATINSGGIITWTPDEAQGPGTNIIISVVTDNGSPALSATNSFTVVVNEVNVPPVLSPLANTNVNELTALTLTNSAIDSDSPVNALTYQLIDAPPGATIDTNGVITWTPTEAEGPVTNSFTTIVTDYNPDAINPQQFTVTNTFSVVANEVNVAPVLTLPPSQTINEMEAFTANATATDADLPLNALTFVLVSGPAGLSVSPAGIIAWTPDETQGPSTNIVVVSVTDFNPPAINATSLSTTSSFELIVREVNTPPVLSLANTNINEMAVWIANATATDADNPTNALVFALVAGPAGLSVSPGGGISWTPTEVHGPGTNTVLISVSDTNPIAVNVTSLSVTGSFEIVVQELNTAPVISLPANTNINEMVAFAALATATDLDDPTNAHTFALVSGPIGLTVSPAGLINWTPTEDQGPGTNTVLISVTDTNPIGVNATSLSVTSSFQIVVREVNTPPVLTLPANTNVNEMASFAASATASDSDDPTNALTFALVSGPAGLTVSPAGLVNWTPAEDQGPGTNTVLISVTDTNSIAVNATSLSVTSSFEIFVSEVNVAPVLGALTDRSVNPGQTISFTATATDADLPTNTLSYALVSPPSGADITSDGRFTWRAPAALAGTTNTIQVRVQDNGVPVLNDVKTFTVIVNSLGAPVVLTPVSYLNGQFRFQISGPVGPDYVTEASANLSDWVRIGTNQSPTLPFEFNDPAAGVFSNRVYRVRLQP